MATSDDGVAGDQGRLVLDDYQTSFRSVRTTP
jgi:hypothetical protein